MNSAAFFWSYFPEELNIKMMMYIVFIKNSK